MYVCVCMDHMMSHDCHVTFDLQIENDAGKWVKLSDEALKQFECQGNTAYALAFSSERKQEFLEEKEVSSTRRLILGEQIM